MKSGFIFSQIIYYSLIVLLPAKSHSEVINIKDTVSFDPYIALITWSNIHADITKYKIYGEEKYLERFPSTLIDTLSKDATGWRSSVRENINFLGLNIRIPSQWGDLRYFTSGSFYTIGIEVIFLDSLTKKEISIKKIIHVFPFKIHSSHSLSTTSGLKDSINIENSNILPYPLQKYLKHNEKKLQLEIENVLHDEVKKIYLDEKFFYFILKNGNIVEYDRPPNRPLALGDENYLEFTFGSIFFFLILLILIALIYLLARTLPYLNFLSNRNNKAPKIIEEILGKERFPILVIFFIVSLIHKNFFGNLLSKIVSFLTSIKLEFESLDSMFFAQIRGVYLEYSFYETSMIRQKITEIVKKNISLDLSTEPPHDRSRSTCHV